MRYNVLLLAAAATGCGFGGAMAAPPQATAPAQASDAVVRVAPVRVTAPTPRPMPLRVARAVLDGVGVESGVRAHRVNGALARLSSHVREQSDPSALRMAFQAYYSYKERHPQDVRKPYLYFVDYGLEADEPRGYVFDMESLTVVDGPFTVAHGRGSAPTSTGIPTRFSNRHGSNSTSLGLYLAQETYTFRGKSGGRRYSSVGLRLRGLSGRFNSAARARGVVAHGAPYVTAARAGRSEGCPAVEQDRARRLLPQIANGGMVFLFSPRDRAWMREDPWANAISDAIG